MQLAILGYELIARKAAAGLRPLAGVGPRRLVSDRARALHGRLAAERRASPARRRSSLRRVRVRHADRVATSGSCRSASSPRRRRDLARDDEPRVSRPSSGSRTATRRSCKFFEQWITSKLVHGQHVRAERSRRARRRDGALRARPDEGQAARRARRRRLLRAPPERPGRRSGPRRCRPSSSSSRRAKSFTT